RKIADYELLNLDPENESFALLRAGEAAQIIGALDTCLKTKGTRGGRFEKAKTAAEQRRQFLLFGPGASGS
ncbi:MAG: hypothetical protein J0I06_20265, partial [Planctomycetes bacterium]|nr:hypothetical protein [Planctomycetota bacterium]